MVIGLVGKFQVLFAVPSNQDNLYAQNCKNEVKHLKYLRNRNYFKAETFTLLKSFVVGFT